MHLSQPIFFFDTSSSISSAPFSFMVNLVSVEEHLIRPEDMYLDRIPAVFVCQIILKLESNLDDDSF
jgi:hypothetical protein